MLLLCFLGIYLGCPHSGSFFLEEGNIIDAWSKWPFQKSFPPDADLNQEQKIGNPYIFEVTKCHEGYSDYFWQFLGVENSVPHVLLPTFGIYHGGFEDLIRKSVFQEGKADLIKRVAWLESD